jgi:rod shape-determining protein MreD
MKRLWVLIPVSVIAIFLDSFLFPNLSDNGIRPLFVLAAALGAAAATKVQDSILIALIGGLLTDLFANPYLGLSAAAYLLAVVILYALIRKDRPKLPLLFVFAMLGCTAAEALILGFSLILGARFAIGYRLLSATLPSLILEASMVLPLAAILKPAGKGTFDRR